MNTTAKTRGHIFGHLALQHVERAGVYDSASGCPVNRAVSCHQDVR